MGTKSREKWQRRTDRQIAIALATQKSSDLTVFQKMWGWTPVAWVVGFVFSTGIACAFVDLYTIGYTLDLLAVFIAFTKFVTWEDFKTTSLWKRVAAKVLAVLVVAGVLLSCYLLTRARQDSVMPGAKLNDPIKPPLSPNGLSPTLSMEQLVKEDFKDSGMFTHNEELNGKNTHVHVESNVMIDGVTHLAVLTYYFPPVNDPVSICAYLASHYKTVLKGADEFKGWGIYADGGSAYDFSQYIFSKRAFVYYQGPLGIQQQAAIDALFKQQGLTVTVRGDTYLKTKLMDRAMRMAHPDQP